ncbi:DNA polymerase domain-containing protein [Candidatus Bathyarchaeota archaeon]|nr:MAG: DNA polymerase domain-containing protein [Candidatus Bathyarchaeota archaeon]TMI30964.1 MAG: DNA polymerase domain-containing protein [Candidatus Bathyarchaeota archaeon]
MKRTEEVVNVAGRQIVLSNLDKPMWKKEGITKADLIQYYVSVAPWMVRFIKNRPLMLNRFPHGVSDKSFVQKDWPHHPSWVRIVPVPSHDKPGKAVRHVVCEDEATLVWLADMACVEINQFLSSAPKFDWHDLLLVDLDPYPPAEFEDALGIADSFHTALDQMKLRHLIKTSGADGIHILIPILPKYTIEVIRRFVLLVGVLLEELAPKKVTTSRRIADRVGKVYVDWFQNGLGKTVAAPFSLRPNPGAPVSFPLDPRSLKKHVTPEEFNIHTVVEIGRKDHFTRFDVTPDQSLDGAFKELGASP